MASRSLLFVASGNLFEDITENLQVIQGAVLEMPGHLVHELTDFAFGVDMFTELFGSTDEE